MPIAGSYTPLDDSLANPQNPLASLGLRLHWLALDLPWCWSLAGLQADFWSDPLNPLDGPTQTDKLDSSPL